MSRMFKISAWSLFLLSFAGVIGGLQSLKCWTGSPAASEPAPSANVAKHQVACDTLHWRSYLMLP
jgi:hypothetical protein